MNITSQRLIIRPIQVNDARALFAYRRNAAVNKYQGWIPQTLEDAETFIQKTATEMNIPGTWFQLALLNKIDKKLIGDMGVHFKHERDQVELGFTIASDKQGQGLATEALQAVLSYLFVQMKKHRVTASVDPRNTASIRVLEKLKFRKEAHFIESYYMDGEWADDALYALLSKEWKPVDLPKK